MHRTLKAETTLPPGKTLRGQQRKFNHFIQEYNFERPHESLELETPSHLYMKSNQKYPKKIESFIYPDRYETRLVSKNGGIRWNHNWVNVSSVLQGQTIGFEEVAYGVWHVYFCHVKIGVFYEQQLRIIDPFDRLLRKNV